MWFLLLWGFGIIASIIHWLINGSPSSLNDLSHVLLFYQFTVTFVLLGIIGFMVNVIYADNTSKKLGWPGGPFQIKYGFSQLGLGVLGLLTIWLRGNFWAAVIVSMYIYGLSGLWTHTEEMIKVRKLDLNHLFNIIMDIIYQAFITVFSILAGQIWS